MLGEVWQEEELELMRAICYDEDVFNGLFDRLGCQHVEG